MRKLHTISWDKIKRPRKEGGLCLTAAKPKNLALLAKLNWRMKTEKDQLWAKVLRLKYANPNRCYSGTWVGIKRGKHIFEQGTKWNMGSDSGLSFLHDKWLIEGKL